MSAKAAIFVLCAQALLIQSVLSQVCGRANYAAPNIAAPSLAANGLGFNGLGTNSLAYNGLSSGLAGNCLAAPALEIALTSGGALPVTSASAVAPNSLVVASENVYEGPLSVVGELPFVGTVGMEGVVPSAGSGAVNHACGNGNTRMVSQEGAVVGAGLGISPASGLAANYGGIGALGRASAVPFVAGLGGLAYGATGLAGAYPATGFAGAYPPAGFAGAYPAAGFAGAYRGAGYGAAAPYGGAGEGNVAVAGELPVAGNTAVAGQVPIMGAVNFGGPVPAAGAVSISGQCACGCGNPNVY